MLGADQFDKSRCYASYRSHRELPGRQESIEALERGQETGIAEQGGTGLDRGWQGPSYGVAWCRRGGNVEWLLSRGLEGWRVGLEGVLLAAGLTRAQSAP